jgi:acyl carrier protein
MADVLFERVRTVLSDVFGVSEGDITRDTTHEDLEGWDSLNLINVMMALEAEFGIALEVDDAAKLVSVPEILSLLAERGAS